MTDADRITELEAICGVQQILIRVLIDAFNLEMKRTGGKGVNFQFSDSQWHAFNQANRIAGIG